MGIPLEESQRAIEDSPATRQPAATRTPAARQDSDSETQTGEYYNPDRRPDEFAKFIRNQSLIDGIELDPRFPARSEDHSQIFQVSRRRRYAGSSKLTAKEQLEGPCTIHCFEDGWGRLRSSHTLGDCRLFTELSNSLKEEKQREDKRTRRTAQSLAPSTEKQYPTSHGRVCMIQEGRPSKAKQDA